MSESPAAATPATPPADDVPMTDADGEEPTADATANADAADLSDDASELSDVNEDEFENFDVNAINIEEADIDQEALKEVKVRKRERKPGEEPTKKKKKESRKDKQQAKKARKRRGGDDDDEVDADGADAEAGRGRRRKAAGGDGAEPRRRKVREETPEDQLDDNERVRRQLEKRVKELVKRPTVRRRKAAGDDLSSFMDEEVNLLRNEMSEAARADNNARTATPPKPAIHKRQLLPKVVALLSRNGREAESAIVDPDNNLMEAVRFFLEPLGDGSLPAYDIQRELFSALLRLPINKETLIASGIGRVVLFYTKSKKPEADIKRHAEKLLAEWTRPILKRSDNYRSRDLQEVEYDPVERARLAAQQEKTGGPIDEARKLAVRAKEARQKALERPNPGNRARLEKAEQKMYTIVPKNNMSSVQRKRQRRD